MMNNNEKTNEYQPTEVEEAREALLKRINRPLEIVRVHLLNADGRILAEDIRAPFSVPSFPKSAMDGYAVWSEDVQSATKDNPVRLRVVGECLAGETACHSERAERVEEAFREDERPAATACHSERTERVEESFREDERPAAAACHSERAERVEESFPAGTALRIMTGAQVPEGYDAVVRQEDTDCGEDVVTIYKGVSQWTNYCKVGEDILKGNVVLQKGSRIGRIEAGVLASLGIDVVPVYRALSVSIISTGTELREVGQPLQAGAIYNSIAYTLSASVREAGFIANCRIVPDDALKIRRALEEALTVSDVVITTGGVSVGKKDLLPEVLEQIGAERIFQRVNIQPGTPTIGSVKNGIPILSLSGNPYAALVNFDLYFWPVAAKITGCDTFQPEERLMISGSEYPKKNKQRRFLRAREEGGKVYLPVKSHASSVLSNLLDCNCYIDLPADTEIRPGDPVRVVRMPG